MNDIQDIKNELVVYTLGQLEATKIERELVGQRIKQVRKQCGLTMIEFGKALNVTNVTVCRCKNGQYDS